MTTLHAHKKGFFNLWMLVGDDAQKLSSNHISHLCFFVTYSPICAQTSYITVCMQTKPVLSFAEVTSPPPNSAAQATIRGIRRAAFECNPIKRQRKGPLFQAAAAALPFSYYPACSAAASQHTLLFPSQQGYYSLFTWSDSLSESPNTHSAATKMSGAPSSHT